ncbi:MAG: tRNA (N(6)-L-threonylcarbamoyladenosine(37)-C(2))-methylthiotransferase MtaB [Bacteroidia bacterium]
MKIALLTLGCKLNFSESATLARKLKERGHHVVDAIEPADLYVLNSCSVTQRAEKDVHKLIRRLHRYFPEAGIVVIGCYAQLSPEKLLGEAGVKAVVGTQEKFSWVEDVEKLVQGAPKVHYKPVEEKFALSYSVDERTRAFLKVQDGCDYKCSFCSVPLSRGKSRSATVEEVVAAAQALASQGVPEIVLTGINLGDFGKEKGLGLWRLMQKLEAALPPSVVRLRLSSVEPNLLVPELVAFVADHPRWAPHFHLPLQSGSAKILRLMQRRYTPSLYEKKLGLICRHLPHAGIGADVLVGFPGEGEKELNEAKAFLRQMPVTYLHVFPYSERPGTKASSLEGGVPWEVRLERARQLRALGLQKKRQFAQTFKGKHVCVLVEKASQGLTENYLRAQGKRQVPPGKLYNFYVEAITSTGDLEGDFVE